MKTIFDFSIVRKKLVIKKTREITLNDLLPVRETLNSIDFIFGDDDKWEYAKLSKSWQATTKVRLQDADKILKFVEENKDNLRMDSIDNTLLTDLTRVFKIQVEAKNEREVKRIDKDDLSKERKLKILKALEESIETINNLAETMGDIL